jgi:DNA ligase 1
MIPSPPKPMLAADLGGRLSKIKYPVYVQPKLDGVRAIIKDGKFWSRSGKLIPNKALQDYLDVVKYLPHVTIDGELVLGDPTDKDVWNKTSSAVMSKDGPMTGIKFHVFDIWDRFGTASFKDRTEQITRWRFGTKAHRITTSVPTTLVHSEAELLVAEEHYTSMGYEGLIIRQPDSSYKQGRSTLNEGALIKMKRFEDAEGVVIGFGERMHNGNPAEKDAFGKIKRSSKKAGMVGRDDLGYFKVKDSTTGVEFELGVGLTDEQRKRYWTKVHCRDLLGQVVTFKFQKRSPTGTPIFPVFKGFRDRTDL